MFRIECFCDDKRLPDVLRALALSGVYNVTPSPVTGAKAQQGKVVGDPVRGSATNIVLSLHGVLTTQRVKAALHKAGFHASSAGGLIARLLKEKRITRKARDNYEVVK